MKYLSQLIVHTLQNTSYNIQIQHYSCLESYCLRRETNISIVRKILAVTHKLISIYSMFLSNTLKQWSSTFFGSRDQCS